MRDALFPRKAPPKDAKAVVDAAEGSKPARTAAR
jgi:hypothetical protein